MKYLSENQEGWSESDRKILEHAIGRLETHFKMRENTDEERRYRITVDGRDYPYTVFALAKAFTEEMVDDKGGFVLDFSGLPTKFWEWADFAMSEYPIGTEMVWRRPVRMRAEGDFITGNARGRMDWRVAIISDIPAYTLPWMKAEGGDTHTFNLFAH